MYTFFESPTHLSRMTFEGGEPPFVSIYLQTHRGSQETKQDKLTLKNLVLEAERSLKAHYGKREYAHMIDNLEALFESPEEDLWRGLKDGLAILANNDDTSVCLLDLMNEEDCWVHFVMAFGMILTVIYSALVIARRRRFAKDFTDYEEEVLGQGPRTNTNSSVLPASYKPN